METVKIIAVEQREGYQSVKVFTADGKTMQVSDWNSNQFDLGASYDCDITSVQKTNKFGKLITYYNFGVVMPAAAPAPAAHAATPSPGRDTNGWQDRDERIMRGNAWNAASRLLSGTGATFAEALEWVDAIENDIRSAETTRKTPETPETLDRPLTERLKPPEKPTGDSVMCPEHGVEMRTYAQGYAHKKDDGRYCLKSAADIAATG